MKPQNENTNYKGLAFKAVSSYQELAHSHGYDIEAHSPNAWERFESYPPDVQKILIERFNTQLSIITELNEDKLNFRDPVQSVWRILSKFNWKPPHDLFQRLSKNDIVEIYLPDQTQLYRNLEYFKYTSYSLTELLFFPWHELFEHQKGFHEKIGEIANAVFVEQCPDDYHEFSHPYIGQEKFSKDRLNVKLQCKAFSSLKGRHSNINEAVLVIWNMELISKLENHYEKEITL